MAWEERNGRSYYYRKVRRGGRVFSVYEGGGLSAQFEEARAAEVRQTRQQERAALRREIGRQDKVDALIDEAWGIVQRAASEALEAAGYHLHKREWRLRRGAAKTI